MGEAERVKTVGRCPTAPLGTGPQTPFSAETKFLQTPGSKAKVSPWREFEGSALKVLRSSGQRPLKS